MNDLHALWYLERCRIINSTRGIICKPSRAVLWILTLAWLVGMFVLHLFEMRAHSYPFPALAEPYASIAAGLFLGFAAINLYAAPSVGDPAFANPADAYFLARSVIPAALISFWLQCRNFVLVFARAFVFGLLMAVYYAHAHMLGAALTLLLALSFVSLARRPAYLAARRFPRTMQALLAAAGTIGVLVAAIPALALALPALQPTSATIVRLDLGAVVLRLWNGDPLALGVFAALVFAMIGLSALGTGELIPDLYEHAQKQTLRLRRLRLGTKSWKSRPGVVNASGSTSLRGPAVELWKHAASMRRSRGMQQLAASVAGGAFCGALCGLIALRSPQVAMTAGGTVLIIWTFGLVMARVGLTRDLRQPLWWMGDGSLTAKLAMGAVGSSLLAVVFLASATLVGAIITRSVPVFVVGLTIAVVVPPAARALAILGFSLLPSAVDRRGPGYIVNVLFLYGSLIVPAITAGALTAFGSSVLLLIFGVVVSYGAQGVLALTIAASRIDERGVEFANAGEG